MIEAIRVLENVGPLEASLGSSSLVLVRTVALNADNARGKVQLGS